MHQNLSQLHSIAEQLPASESIDSILRFANEAVAQLDNDLKQTQNNINNELESENAISQRYDSLVAQINELPTTSVLEPAELERLQTQVLPSMRDEALRLMEDTAKAAKEREFVSFYARV